MGGIIRLILSWIPLNPLITWFLYHSKERKSRYRNRYTSKLQSNNYNCYPNVTVS